MNQYLFQICLFINLKNREQPKIEKFYLVDGVFTSDSSMVVKTTPLNLNIPGMFMSTDHDIYFQMFSYTKWPPFICSLFNSCTIMN